MYTSAEGPIRESWTQDAGVKQQSRNAGQQHLAGVNEKFALFSVAGRGSGFPFQRRVDLLADQCTQVGARVRTPQQNRSLTPGPHHLQI